MLKKLRSSRMKKELKTQLTRERIIEAALIEFSQKGYKAFGINELCKNHKISKGILYHNFSGKSEIYLACVRESFQKLCPSSVGSQVAFPVWWSIWNGGIAFSRIFLTTAMSSLKLG